MFLRQTGNSAPTVVSSPSPASGLYIRTRGGELTKVAIPTDSLAFQTGEALELVTDGKLKATPHCVRVGAGEGAETISIDTLTEALRAATTDIKQIERAKLVGEQIRAVSFVVHLL